MANDAPIEGAGETRGGTHGESSPSDAAGGHALWAGTRRCERDDRERWPGMRPPPPPRRSRGAPFAFIFSRVCRLSRGGDGVSREEWWARRFSVQTWRLETSRSWNRATADIAARTAPATFAFRIAKYERRRPTVRRPLRVCALAVAPALEGASARRSAEPRRREPRGRKSRSCRDEAGARARSRCGERRIPPTVLATVHVSKDPEGGMPGSSARARTTTARRVGGVEAWRLRPSRGTRRARVLVRGPRRGMQTLSESDHHDDVSTTTTATTTATIYVAHALVASDDRRAGGLRPAARPRAPARSRRPRAGLRLSTSGACTDRITNGALVGGRDGRRHRERRDGDRTPEPPLPPLAAERPSPSEPFVLRLPSFSHGAPPRHAAAVPRPPRHPLRAVRLAGLTHGPRARRVQRRRRRRAPE